MSLRRAIYKAAIVPWMLAVFGAVIYVDLGHAEPWLSVSDIPGGSAGGFAGAIVATVVVGKVISSRIGRLERAEWQETGRQAGLRREGDGGSADGPELIMTALVSYR